ARIVGFPSRQSMILSMLYYLIIDKAMASYSDSVASANQEIGRPNFKKTPSTALPICLLRY
ncbi:MAG: hypothetical protein U1C33_00060, partial [Candidatus Cloacimonadaceae bacterium]|nr:hypothetical protein [Candidatus Cloacimonadaceae bacterium]